MLFFLTGLSVACAGWPYRHAGRYADRIVAASPESDDPTVHMEQMIMRDRAFALRMIGSVGFPTVGFVIWMAGLFVHGVT